MRPSDTATIVLSGGGTDGTIGLEEIKGADGITFAQNEYSARQVAMPAFACISDARLSSFY